MENSYYGINRHLKFSEVFDSFNTFKEEYEQSKLKSTLFTDAYLEKLYYLLYAEYGENYIASTNSNIFKYKIWKIMYAKGQEWVKKDEYLNKMLLLTEEEIRANDVSIMNYAENPESLSDGKTAEDKLLDFINNQSVNLRNSSKLNAYTTYIAMIKDITSGFIQEFKRCFLYVVDYDDTLYYEEDL